MLLDVAYSCAKLSIGRCFRSDEISMHGLKDSKSDFWELDNDELEKVSMGSFTLFIPAAPARERTR